MIFKTSGNILRYCLPALLFYLFLLINVHLFAQEITVSSGGSASGVDGTMRYTFGQFFYHVHSDDSTSVLEGVQQPYEISVITDNGQEQMGNIELKAYPNPTSNQLVLEIPENEPFKGSYKLLDNRGDMIDEGIIVSLETIIDLSIHPKGIYFLSVRKKSDIFRIFKIIKN